MYLNGIRVITTEYMTVEQVSRVYRNYRPGERKGRDKRLRRLVYQRVLRVPNTEYVLYSNDSIICHPAMFVILHEAAEAQARLNGGRWAGVHEMK